MALLSFIAQTAKGSANKPGSKLFLPEQLAKIKGQNSTGHLLPIEEDRWTIGDITGTAGSTITQTLASQWLLYLKAEGVAIGDQVPIADPRTPNPNLVLGGVPGKKVVIQGLNNVYVDSIEQTGQTATETTFRVTLQFDHWNAENGGGSTPKLSVDGPYILSQNVCLAEENSDICSGTASDEIKGSGTVTILVQNGVVVANVTISAVGDAGSRSLRVDVADLTIRGPDPGTMPTIELTNLTIGADVSEWLLNAWEGMAKKALTSPDATAAIFANIQAALNSENNIKSVSTLMTEQLQVVMNDLLGTVDGELPQSINEGGQTQVDLYLYDRVFYAMNTESSNWYLPRTMCQLKNPQIDPYAAGTLNLPDIPVSVVTLKNVQLTNLKITGLSNLDVPARTTSFAPGTVTLTADVGALQPPPKLDCCQIAAQAQVTGGFSASATGVAISGGLTVNLATATLTVTASAEGADSSDLVVTVSKMSLAVPDLSKMTISLSIESSFLGFINKFLSSDGIKKQILGQLNGEIGKYLPEISKAATAYGKSMINSNIG